MCVFLLYSVESSMPSSPLLSSKQSRTGSWPFLSNSMVKLVVSLMLLEELLFCASLYDADCTFNISLPKDGAYSKAISLRIFSTTVETGDPIIGSFVRRSSPCS